MSFGQALKAYRLTKNMTQAQFASTYALDRTQLSRVENDEREATIQMRQHLSRSSWRMALTIADEETDGFISNILKDVPNLDLHPAALKDILLKELDEAESALEALIMAKHMDPEKRRKSAERVYLELRDVSQKAAVMQGVLEEEFALDRKQLIKRHEMEVKKGER
ncbi:helix-turn-helix transcriptional regulator [Paenibacillus sp. MWE-103]|uniref:Helix-turn-helix transcriptional regulator n=1 Tax=Paenibacillus artemisiicola TaxID=1172618 RepID=A0ABS3WGE6_9BACL|nr:helix-turn-helix transcriptional regulator [Paenibacillus artemisiicola]MBO7747380.1 helix-turn-helix transcriptional regulator [Paenibacillus artemisiicola]